MTHLRFRTFAFPKLNLNFFESLWHPYGKVDVDMVRDVVRHIVTTQADQAGRCRL